MTTAPRKGSIHDRLERLLARHAPVGWQIARAKARYRARTQPYREPLSERAAACLEEIRREGIVVVPAYYGRETVEAMCADAREPVRELAQDRFSRDHRTHRFEAFGTYRILDAERLGPALRPFFDDPLIWEVARAATCANVASWQRMVELRNGVGQFGSADGYHIDESWHYKFKAFLYLNDVGPEQAPFTYIRRSHLDAPWRRQKERQMYRWNVLGADATFGLRGNYFEDRQINWLLGNLDLEEQVCVGPPGTLILVDTRGIHRGRPIAAGERLMLAQYFEIRNWERVLL